MAGAEQLDLRAAELDEREKALARREAELARRERLAAERDRIADERDRLANHREQMVDEREARADEHTSDGSALKTDQGGREPALDAKRRTSGVRWPKANVLAPLANPSIPIPTKPQKHRSATAANLAPSLDFLAPVDVWVRRL